MRLRWMAALGLLVTTAGAVLAQTATNPPIYSPVLLGSTYSSATNNSLVPMQAKPTGGVATMQRLAAPNADFSHNRFGGGRYFLRTEKIARVSDTLAAYDESGTQRVVLNDLADLYAFWRVRWSLDGSRVAWIGGKYDPNNPNAATTIVGTLTEQGVYVADVGLDVNGNPSALVNIRQIVSGQSGQSLVSNPTHISWTGDNQSIVYLVNELNSYFIYRADASALAPGLGQKINVSGSVPSGPKASPVAGDNRIAFLASGQNAREVWTVTVPAGYSGSTLTPKQITSKASVPDYFYYDWSPNGAEIVYTYGALNAYNRVMKVPSGGGSATVLLSSKSVGYRVLMWRN